MVFMQLKHELVLLSLLSKLVTSAVHCQVVLPNMQSGEETQVWLMQWAEIQVSIISNTELYVSWSTLISAMHIYTLSHAVSVVT